MVFLHGGARLHCWTRAWSRQVQTMTTITTTTTTTSQPSLDQRISWNRACASIREAVDAQATCTIPHYPTRWLHRCIQDARSFHVPQTRIQQLLLEARAKKEPTELCLWGGRWKLFYFLIQVLPPPSLPTSASPSMEELAIMRQHLRNLFQSRGGTLYDDAQAAVAWMFRRRAVVEIVAPLRPSEYWNQASLVDSVPYRVLTPSSIPQTELAQLALDIGVEDVSEILIPLQDLHDHHQENGGLHDVYVKGLAWEFGHSLLPHVQQHLEAYQYGTMGDYRQPWIRQVSHHYVPKQAEYEQDALWKEVPEAKEEREHLLDLMESIREVSFVKALWHNVRNVR